jgi:hypothetical protein
MGTPDDVHKFLGTTEKSLAKIVDGKGDQQAILSKLQSYFEDDMLVGAPDGYLDAKMESEAKEHTSAILKEMKTERPVFKNPFE